LRHDRLVLLQLGEILDGAVEVREVATESLVDRDSADVADEGACRVEVADEAAVLRVEQVLPALRHRLSPKSWKDLLNPQYRGLVGYLDPASAFVGYVGAVAINQAFGGDLSNFDRAIKYFAELQKNQPIVPKQTSYARVLSGEIPILFDYDFNAYRGKYKDKANIAFVI